MNQRKRITLQTDVNATCAIRHTLALSVLGLGFEIPVSSCGGFLIFAYKTNAKPLFLLRRIASKTGAVLEAKLMVCHWF